MSWWHILLWALGGAFAFDCLFIGLLYASNRPMCGLPRIARPDAKGKAQPATQNLWLIDGGGR